MRRLPAMLAMLVAASACVPASAALQVVVLQGLGGESAYDEEFSAQVRALGEAGRALTDRVQVLGPEQSTRAQVQTLFRQLAGSLTAEDRIAVYLVGHGSFDGEEYKFNVRGADITARDLSALLNALPARDQLVVATGSSSGALQESLKRDARIVLTATRSGNERNATRFGGEFVAALSDPGGDTDKNGSVSAQEAFDFAQRRVKEFYERDVRLATEHAMLSGERAARFAVARSGGAGVVAADGTGAAPASASPERARITDALDALRLRKDELPAAEYESQLEALLLQLAEFDAGAGANAGAAAGQAPATGGSPP